MARHPDAPETPASVLTHIPHASILIPAEIKTTFLLTDEELRDELLRMTDWYTDELFTLPGDVATAVHYPVSRLVVDPERFSDDSAEPMAARGTGVIYERTSWWDTTSVPPTHGCRARGATIDLLPSAPRAAGRHGEPYLGSHGRCLLIDGHSFATDPLPQEADQAPGRPDICIGTDPFHTSPALASLTAEVFRQQGFSVECDRPFQGSLVPMPFYQAGRRTPRSWSRKRRAIYMDERSGAKLPSFDSARLRIDTALRRLAEEWG